MRNKQLVIKEGFIIAVMVAVLLATVFTPPVMPGTAGWVYGDSGKVEITLNKSSATLYTGAKLKLKATVISDDGISYPITWTSSNEDYAGVDAKGNVTVKAVPKGKKKGTVVITASANGEKAKCKIAIKRTLVSAMTFEGGATVLKGTVFKLGARVKLSEGTNKSVKYSIEKGKKDMAQIDGRGVITIGDKAGKFIVTARPKYAVNENGNKPKKKITIIVDKHKKGQVCTHTFSKSVASDKNHLYPIYAGGETGKLKKMVAIAESQVGYRNGTDRGKSVKFSLKAQGGWTKYGAWYGIPQTQWCDMFVSWCAAQAGIPSAKIKRDSYVPSHLKWYKNHSRYKSKKSGYKPKPGDFVFFDWEPNGSPNHIGIVISYEDGRVMSVEGNAARVRAGSKKYEGLSYGVGIYDNTDYILGYGNNQSIK
jgi:hypothetical protein